MPARLFVRRMGVRGFRRRQPATGQG